MKGRLEEASLFASLWKPSGLNSRMSDVNQPRLPLSKEEQTVYRQFLQHRSLCRSQAVVRTGLGIAQIRAIFDSLDAKGLIRRMSSAAAGDRAAAPASFEIVEQN